MCTKDRTGDILRITLGVSIGLMLSKYLTLSFNFQIPTVAMMVVLGMDKFNLKVFIKSNSWIIGAATLGLFITEIFRNNHLVLSVFTFGFIFSVFFFNHKNPSGMRSAVLGYSFTTIFATYSDKNVESMVTDIYLVTIIGGLLGWGLLLLFPKKPHEMVGIKKVKKEREEIHKNIGNTLLISIMLFLIWMSFMIFDIRGAFFAYATLAGIYGNLSLETIHKLSPLNIGIHVTGCTLAIIFSFFMDGRGITPPIFLLGLMCLFYPLGYMGFYGNTPKKRAFSMGLIRAIILPIALYLTPNGDIVQQASTRAIQITVMVIGSMVITNLLLKIEEGKKDGKNTSNNRKNK